MDRRIIAEYIEAHAGQSPRTIQTIEKRLERFAAEVEGVELDDVSQAHVAAFFDGLVEAGLAAATCAGYRSTLKAFFKWAKKRKYVKRNPTKILRERRYQFSYRPVRSRAAPVDSVSALVAVLPAFAASGDGPRNLRDAAMVSVAIDSGARRGELHALRRADVADALDHPVITRSGLTCYVVTSTGKTGPVTIRFYEGSAELLRQWLAHMPPTSPWVWASLRTHQRLRVDAMKLGLDRACAFAGVPSVGWHSLRKRVVTDIIELTGDPKVGSAMANHRSTKTTQEYYNDLAATRVDDAGAQLAAQRREAAELNALFSPDAGRDDPPPR